MQIRYNSLQMIKQCSIYIALLLSSIFLYLQCPFFPFAKATIYYDSSIFMYVGQGILDGLLPYKDIMDHKGLLLYFYNALCLSIGGYSGIGFIIIEIISLFIAHIFIFKSAVFLTDRKIALLSTISAFLFTIPLFMGGNITESWVLPYLAISTFIIIGDITDKHPLSITRMCVLSFCFVMAIFLKASFGLFWLFFALCIIIHYIKKKEYVLLLKYCLFALLFICMFSLPFIIYLYSNHILKEAYYCMYYFNAHEYINRSFYLFAKHFLSILIGKRGYIIFYPLFITSIVLLFIHKKQSLFGVLFFITGYLICSLGYTSQHYFLIFVPILIYPLIHIFQLIDLHSNMKYAIWIFFIVINLYNFNYQYHYIKGNITPLQSNDATLVLKQDVLDVNKYIINHSNKEDKIYAQAFASLYISTHLKANTRFPFTMRHSSEQEKYFLKEFEACLPRFIVYEKNPLPEFINPKYDISYLLTSKYTPVLSFFVSNNPHNEIILYQLQE